MTDVQRRFLAAPRLERTQIMSNACARAELTSNVVNTIDGVFNFRDLGALRGSDGRFIRTGLLYRSARFDSVTALGRRELVERLGVRTDLDLRGNDEVRALGGKSPLGDGVAWRQVPLWSYAGIGERHGRQMMREALATVFCPTNWPLAFHCKTGKDRTGTLAFVLLALLGVDEEAIRLDWEMTAFHVPELSRMDHPTRYDRLLAFFGRRPGATLKEKVESYVRELGFSDEEIGAFRRALLVPPLEVKRLSVKVGASRPFSVLHVSDSHLAWIDGRDDEAVHAFARVRKGIGRELGGLYLDAALDHACRHEMQVVHTGDVVEFASAANAEWTTRLFRERTLLACVGNHEFWKDRKVHDERDKLRSAAWVRSAFPGEQPAFIRELNGVVFFVFDNSFGRVSDEVVESFGRTVSRGRPMVLVCHVPFPTPELMADAAVSSSLMGEGHAAGDVRTQDFIAQVRAEPLVKAILCGHLHVARQVRFSPSAMEYVAGALFNGVAQEVAFR